jgi:hypothetical protein
VRYALSVLLLAILAVTPAGAATLEAQAQAPNFLQEVDITFWQTLPFAVFWGHFLDRQVSAYLYPGSAAHWTVIMTFAGVVSFGNALYNANRVVSSSERSDGLAP